MRIKTVSSIDSRHIRFESQASGKKITPLRSRKIAGSLIMAGLFTICITSVFIRVLQVRYGHEIQKHRTEVANFRSEVRDFRSRKAGLSSYSNIETAARKMGMVFPKSASQMLTVRVPEGAVPPTWRDEPSPIGLAVRDNRLTGKKLLAMKGESIP